MKKITTAVIPVGGLGTRFYPVTKTVRKYLLPVYDRPVLDYLLDNCLAAGLQRVIFVTNEGDKQIAHYLQEDAALKQTLVERGCKGLYDSLLEPLHSRLKSIIVEQKRGAIPGTSNAILCAKEYLDPDEAFVVMMGDDFLWRSDGGSDLLDTINAYHQTGAAAACMAERVRSFADMRRKAVVLSHRSKDGFRYMDGIIEKPTEDLHGRLASIARFVVDARIFDTITSQKPNPTTGEMCITDTLHILCQNYPVAVQLMKGRQLDCGTPENWLKANNFIHRKMLERAHNCDDPAPTLRANSLHNEATLVK